MWSCILFLESHREEVVLAKKLEINSKPIFDVSKSIRWINDNRIDIHNYRYLCCQLSRNWSHEHQRCGINFTNENLTLTLHEVELCVSEEGSQNIP